MADVIRMPRLSDTMQEGVIKSWIKKVGDAVKPGDVLAEVETDKATMDLEAFQEGILLHVAVPSGAVPVEGIIAIIGKKVKISLLYCRIQLQKQQLLLLKHPNLPKIMNQLQRLKMLVQNQKKIGSKSHH